MNEKSRSNQPWSNQQSNSLSASLLTLSGGRMIGSQIWSQIGSWIRSPIGFWRKMMQTLCGGRVPGGGAISNSKARISSSTWPSDLDLNEMSPTFRGVVHGVRGKINICFKEDGSQPVGRTAHGWYNCLFLLQDSLGDIILETILFTFEAALQSAVVLFTAFVAASYSGFSWLLAELLCLWLSSLELLLLDAVHNWLVNFYIMRTNSIF